MEMPTQEAIEILGECYPVVCTAVPQATNRIFLNFPGYRESDETPPAVRNNRSKWIDIRPDFDGLLGQYHPPRITVYRKAIVAVANEFDLHPEHLKRLVDLHEWAHALHHLGSSSRTHVFSASRKAKKSKNFRETSEELKEQIAQLATLLTLRSLAERVRYEKSKKFYDELENVLSHVTSISEIQASGLYP
jgi:hypothetical protein